MKILLWNPKKMFIKFYEALQGLKQLKKLKRLKTLADFYLISAESENDIFMKFYGKHQALDRLTTLKELKNWRKRRNLSQNSKKYKKFYGAHQELKQRKNWRFDAYGEFRKSEQTLSRNFYGVLKL